MNYFEQQMNFGSLESAYLSPTEPSEPNAYDDWWYTLEDISLGELMEGI